MEGVSGGAVGVVSGGGPGGGVGGGVLGVAGGRPGWFDIGGGG